MKTTTIKKINNYPKLKKDNNNNIILFSNKSTGVVIHSNGEYKVGFHCSDWNPSDFKTYFGAVILENQ